MRAWPMSDEGLFSLTSLPMSKNPVENQGGVSEPALAGASQPPGHWEAPARHSGMGGGDV